MKNLQKKEINTLKYYNDHGHAWMLDRKADKPSFWEKECDELYKLLPQGRLLEIGCGSGKEAELLINKGYAYAGIDASSTMVTMAQQHNPGAAIQQALVYDLPFADKTFDGFWTAATLLHVPKQRIGEALQSIQRVVKSGGIGFISLKEGDGESLDDKPTNRWFAFYRLEEFKGILEKNGFTVISMNKRYQESRKMDWLTFFVRVGETL